MILDTTIQGKSITIYNNGDMYVNGSYTGLRRWQNSPKNWSNSSGQEISDLKGKDVQEVLQLKGFIRWLRFLWQSWLTSLWVFFYERES